MSALSYDLNESNVRSLLGVVDKGLTRGLGKPKPGAMCVEAAVCYAMGLPHSDEPLCVGAAVRAFKIRLNDAEWSSNETRAKGMRRIAVAQLGSEKIDQQKFRELVVDGVTRQMVPIALRAAAKLNPKHAEALEACAVRCETEGTTAALSEARKAAIAADAAYAAYAANAAAYDAAYAAAYDAAAYAAAYAAYAAAYAAYAAYAAAYAAYAAYAANAAYAERDRILTLVADIGERALIELGSPGCAYLYLCDGAQP